MRTAALVLAGGASRRMGRDKLSLPRFAYGERTVVRHVVDVARAEARHVTVLVSPQADVAAYRLPKDVQIHRDRAAHRGPLTALAAAWETAAGGGWDAAFVLAGDLPGLDRQVLVRLRAELAGHGEDVDGAVVVRDGSLQPLLGCYRRQAGRALMGAVSTGTVRLLDAVQGLRLVRLDGGSEGWPEWWTRPIHTPDDYALWLREAGQWRT